MTTPLETIAFASKNISSRVLLGTHIATVDGPLTLDVSMTGLNGAAATLTLDVVVERASNDYAGDRYSRAKRDATSTRELLPALLEEVEAADVVEVYGQSTNSSDTNVSGEIVVRDAVAANVVAIADPAQQQVSRIVHGQDFVYVAHDGNDATSGASLKAAVEGASAGTLVLVGVGVFDLDNDDIVTPADVAIIGTGIGSTIIASAKHGGVDPVIVFLADSVRISKLTVHGTFTSVDAENGEMQVPIGLYGTSADNVLVEDVEMLGPTDAAYLYLGEEPSGEDRITFRRCIFRSKWDGIVINSAGHYLFDRCQFLVNGPHADLSALAAAIVADAGIITLDECVLAASYAGSATVHGVRMQGTADVRANHCSVFTSATSGSAYDIGASALTAAKLSLVGCSFDVAKVQTDANLTITVGGTTAGNVTGKVLGGGSATIAGVGAQVNVPEGEIDGPQAYDNTGQVTALPVQEVVPADGSITDAKFATDAITAAAVAADVAAEIEAAMVNEGDATALLAAIAAKIADENVTAEALGTSIRDAILDRVLAGNHDDAGSVGALLQNAGSALALTSTVDGVQLGKLFQIILAVLANEATAPVTVVSNTKDITFFARDGETELLTLRFGPDGERTASTIDPA